MNFSNVFSPGDRNFTFARNEFIKGWKDQVHWLSGHLARLLHVSRALRQTWTASFTN